MKRALLWLAPLWLAACATPTPAPDAPTLGLQEIDRFAHAPTGATAPTEADLRWWHRLNDPALADWVERALQHNPDVAIARERVVQARALLRSAQGARAPQLGAEARVDARSRREADQRALEPSAALNLDWDLDLWGGLRQSQASAAAQLLRSEDLVQAARLSTAATTARAYVAWQQARLDEALLREALDLQRETLRVADVRVQAGLAPRLDGQRAQAELATVQADIAQAQASVTLAANALQVLAGQRPAPLSQAGAAALPVLDGAPPVGRPLDLLRQRPDLRAAENALAAAAADVGVAQASLYPSLRLPGTLLLSSGALGAGVFDLVSATLSAVLQASLFDGGQRRAEVQAAQARLREARELYRQTLLQALQQAEDALVSTEAAARRTEALNRAVEASNAATAQAQTLYVNGLRGFIDVLDAQRSALGARRAQLVARGDATRAAIAGFEALGLIEADTPP